MVKIKEYSPMRKMISTLATVAFMMAGPLHGADITWIGTTNSLTLNTNWLPADTPASGDTALFDGVQALTTDPSLFPTEAFTVLGLQFVGAPQTFQFMIDGQNVPAAPFLSLGVGGNNGGVDNSILGASAVPQQIDVVRGAVLAFSNESSADINLTGTITYNLVQDSLFFPTSLDFNNSRAGKATINSSGNPFLPLGISFTNQSDAEMATINAMTNTAILVNDSTLGSAIVNLTDSSMVFAGTGTPDASMITASGSNIDFNASPAVSTAQVTLLNISRLLVNNDLTLASLATDSTSTVNLSGNTLTIGDGPSTVIAGVISGFNGVLIKEGDSTVQLTGNNNYTGGTFVNKGTLIASVANLPANRDIVNLDGTLIFPQNVNAAFGGRILAGNGVLRKQGHGTLTFNTDHSGFNGTTLVLEGQLVLNNLLGGDATVSPMAILSGTGKLLGNLHMMGTIRPGNTIGTFSVGGNYQQGTTGIYEAEINGAGQSDLIDVDGSAALAGTLSIMTLDGVIDPSQVYTILHADGGVSGFFELVKSNNVLMVPRVVYLPNDVQVTVQHLFTVVCKADNSRKIGEQLISITSPTPQEQAVLTQLTTLASSPDTINDACKAISQISGEQYTTLLLASELANRQFIRRLYDPLRPIIATPPCCSEEWDCCDDEFASFNFPHYSSYDASSGVWIQAGGGRSFLRGDSNASGFKMDSYQINLGIQASPLKDWTFGAAGGYEYDYLHYNVGGTGRNNIGLLALYSLYRPCDYYVLGDFVFSYNHSRIKRSITVGSLRFKARSKPQSFCSTLYLEAGKDFNYDETILQPFLGIEVTNYAGCNFKEHGASPLDLSIHSNNRTLAYSRLGIHLLTTDFCSCWHLNLDLAWQCRLTTASNRIRENFEDFGDSFTIHGVSVPRNSIDGAANISVELCDQFILFAEFTGQRWERASTYNFTIGLIAGW